MELSIYLKKKKNCDDEDEKVEEEETMELSVVGNRYNLTTHEYVFINKQKTSIS